MLTDRIIVADQKVKELLLKNYGIDESKFAIIPMGANIDLFRSMDKHKCREILNLKNDCKYVGFVGTLYPFQGLTYLIEAAPLILEKYNKIKFLIVGSGIDEKHIKGLVKEKKLTENFIFTGAKKYDTIPYYINSFDVCISLVTPRRSLSFTFPLKIYEYLLCSRPVVIGNLKNLNELLGRKVTPVIDAIDSRVLSKTIIEVLERSDRLRDESAELRKIVLDKFSWKRTAERTLNLFKAVMPAK